MLFAALLLTKDQLRHWSVVGSREMAHPVWQPWYFMPLLNILPVCSYHTSLVFNLLVLHRVPCCSLVHSLNNINSLVPFCFLCLTKMFSKLLSTRGIYTRVSLRFTERDKLVGEIILVKQLCCSQYVHLWLQIIYWLNHQRVVPLNSGKWVSLPCIVTYSLC